MQFAFVPSPPPSPLAGEIAALAAALIWTFTVCIHKYYGKNVPPRLLNFFKYRVVGACFAGAGAMRRPEIPAHSSTWRMLALSETLCAQFPCPELHSPRTASLPFVSPLCPELPR